MNINTDRLKLEVQRATKPFLLLVVLLTAGVVVTIVQFNKLSFQRPWDDYRIVRAEVVDAKGTSPGREPVRIAGVRVGVVRDWHVDGDRAVLTLAIREKYARHIYRDAKVRLRPVTPLQDMYVAVDRGTPSAGELADGGLIPASQTVTPVDISRVLNVFDTDTRDQLGNLIRGLGSGLDDRGAQLETSFAQLMPFLVAARDLTDALDDRRRETARLVHSLGGITTALGARDRQLAGLVSDGNATLGQLASHEAPLRATIQALPRTVRDVRSTLATLATAEDELDPALRALRPVAKELKPGLDALRRFADDATPALRKLTPAVDDLEPLAAALDPMVRHVQLASERLRPQVPQVEELTRMIVKCKKPISNFFQWTPSILKFGDANGANPRADVSIGLDTLDAKLGDPSLQRPYRCTDDFKQEDAG